MKRITYIALVLLILALALYRNSYWILSRIKNQLRDEVQLEIVNAPRRSLKLLVVVEHDTLCREQIGKSRKITFKRTYGKNRFFIADGKKVTLLNCSYYKASVWEKSLVNIKLDFPALFWERRDKIVITGSDSLLDQ